MTRESASTDSTVSTTAGVGFMPTWVAGEPATRAFSGTGFSTRLPGAIRAPLPMEMLPSTVESGGQERSSQAAGERGKQGRAGLGSVRCGVQAATATDRQQSTGSQQDQQKVAWSVVRYSGARAHCCIVVALLLSCKCRHTCPNQHVVRNLWVAVPRLLACASQRHVLFVFAATTVPHTSECSSRATPNTSAAGSAVAAQYDACSSRLPWQPPTSASGAAAGSELYHHKQPI